MTCYCMAHEETPVQVAGWWHTVNSCWSVRAFPAFTPEKPFGGEAGRDD